MNKGYSKLPSEILNSRPELVETKIGISKGIIGTIPYLGTMINELLFDIPNRIQQARINKTVEILSTKIKAFEKEDFIHTDYLNSDNFFDFTRVLFETTLKIQSEDKRNLLANVYLDSIKKSANFETSKNRLFIQFINDLTAIQIEILKYIKKNGNHLVEIGTYDTFFNDFKKIKKSFYLNNYEFKSYCNDLEIKGLINLGAGLNDYKDKSSYLATNKHKDSSVTITRFGNEFLNFLIK